MRNLSRSRSPLRLEAPSLEVREEILSAFARLYWAAPDGVDSPPWLGRRAAEIVHFRCRLVALVEQTVQDLAPPVAPLERQSSTTCISKADVIRWQRFTFYEDLARMSDVLFRGPVEPRHADDIDIRIHNSWRKLQPTVVDFDEFNAVVCDFRVSAVRVAMMLETARPPEASEIDGHFQLPDARSLASLLSLRCEKDDPEELGEMYRLVCQKLQGHDCSWCGSDFDECSSAGTFDGSEALVVPMTVPRIFVPQCGHAVHTVCFGTQIIPEENRGGLRGHCRKCGLHYAWSSIDVDPMINAFCLLFGSYVDRRAREMCEQGEVIQSAAMSIAEICQNFSQELGGLVNPASAWILMAKRHVFDADPETIEIIGDTVLQFLLPPEGGSFQATVTKPTVIGPDDFSDDDTASQDGQERESLTEVFLPDEDFDAPFGDTGSEPASEADEMPLSPELEPEHELDLPPLSLPPT